MSKHDAKPGEAAFISRNINHEFDEALTFGQRAADRVAEFGGSWRFISIFGCILFVWMGINILLLANRGYDPYPFILLNLCLSCLAALQAPIIMMSQNRQAAKDRLRAEHDYEINLKAEIEIRNMQEQLGKLMRDDWQRLLDIQQAQIEMMRKILEANAPQS